MSCQANVGVLGCSHLERDRGSAGQRHADVDVRKSTQREHAICSEQRKDLTGEGKGLCSCYGAARQLLAKVMIITVS